MTEHGILVAAAFVGIGVLLGVGFALWGICKMVEDMFE